MRGSTLCRLWLLFFTLFLCSCISIDKTLGENLIPTDQDMTLLFKSFDLPIDSRPTDSLQISNQFFLYNIGLPVPLLFGSCNDPIFGKTEAGAIFQFLPYSTYSYGDQPEPISLTLMLNRDKSIVLDQSQYYIPQNLFVHEITTDLSYKHAYNNSLLSEEWNHDPISLPGQLYFGTDSIRIALSLDFARELLGVTQAEKDSSELFTKRFKGLYLKTEQPDAGINTGRLNFSSISSALLMLKYQTNGADSTVYYGGNYYGFAFNSVSHSSSSLDSNPSEHVYYQGIAGTKPYIDFVALTDTIRSWADQFQIDIHKLLISRAEVRLSYDSEIDYTLINQYPFRLYPYIRTYTDTTAYYLPIRNIYDSNADGNINRSKFYYSINITSYLLSLLQKEQVTERDNAWLMETTYYTDEYSNPIYYFSYSTYPLALFKGTETDAKPTLNITYAVLK